jgi:hypothetical protein
MVSPFSSTGYQTFDFPRTGYLSSVFWEPFIDTAAGACKLRGDILNPGTIQSEQYRLRYGKTDFYQFHHIGEAESDLDFANVFLPTTTFANNAYILDLLNDREQERAVSPASLLDLSLESGDTLRAELTNVGTANYGVRAGWHKFLPTKSSDLAALIGV